MADKEVCGVLRRQTLSVCLSNSEYFWPNALPTNMGKVNVVTNHISLYRYCVAFLHISITGWNEPTAENFSKLIFLGFCVSGSGISAL